MKNEKAIDRSFQNSKNEVIESDVPKSGFNLTYRNHLGGLVLGRLYPQSIQHTMAGDKFSGSNEANVTFEQLSTPVVDTMDVCVHNFYTTLRSIDKRWEKFMTPTKLNNMNRGLSVPTFSLTEIIKSVVLNFINVIFAFDVSSTPAVPKIYMNLGAFYGSLSSSWDYVYHSDSLLDLIAQIRVDAGIPNSNSVVFDLTDSTDKVKFVNVMSDIFDFFVGKRSLLDYLGYLYISHNDIETAFLSNNGYLSPSYISAYADGTNPPKISNWLYNADDVPLINNFITTYDNQLGWIETPYKLQNEYALRAYYAIWFEYYRNYDLEPRSNSLPEYHDFAGNSIFNGTPAYPFNTLHYLVPRIRSWQQDAFTTAGIDDISRHVFAPLLTMSTPVVVTPDSSLQPSGILDNNLIEQTIEWRNPATGVVSSVQVPLPSRVVKALQSSPNTAIANPIGLELFTLRKAQMLENYLKRIYYGGDEYRDRMLHLYGSRIEDYRINRPQWLSSSLDEVNPRQEVANTGVLPSDSSGVSIGERYATATASQSGTDGFTEFSSEFGIVISMLSIMPHATYDPYLLQNMQISYSDFPIPQFANQMEDVISSLEIARQSSHQSFGYAPYAHAYRYRVDEVHGDYHDTKYDYCFLRYWNANNVPNLSWSFIHCRPQLPMFVNSVLLDGQCYGTFKHNFLVERPLPSPVETI